MPDSLRRRIAALERLTVGELRARYEELFGEAARTSNRQHLLRRISWRMQAMAEGGLSERARRRAEELADEFGLRATAPTESGEAPPKAPRGRLRGTGARKPPPGTVLVRPYKGRTLEVVVQEDGFLFEGKVWGSLTAIARAVTGSSWSGTVFFGLRARPRKKT